MRKKTTKRKLSGPAALSKLLENAAEFIRRDAFQAHKPVVISEDGKVYFLFADGHREEATQRKINKYLK